MFRSPEFLPNVCEYTPKLSKDVLDNSNIIILNAQKLINDQELDDLWEDDNEYVYSENNSNGKVIKVGRAHEYGQGTIIGDR